jgi:hypothetical protein
MRPLWFDHLEEMLAKVDSSKLEVWGRGDIEQLFRVKRSAALNIMDAIGRGGRSENRRQIEKSLLQSFLQEFRDIVLPVGTDKRKRAEAIKNADELLRKKSSAGVPAQAAQTPPSSNQNTDVVLAKPLVIEIDPVRANRLDQAAIELGLELDQVVKQALDDFFLKKKPKARIKKTKEEEQPYLQNYMPEPPLDGG